MRNQCPRCGIGQLVPNHGHSGRDCTYCSYLTVPSQTVTVYAVPSPRQQVQSALDDLIAAGLVERVETKPKRRRAPCSICGRPVTSASGVHKACLFDRED